MVILKAVGAFIGSFVLLLVGMFFLYPYINQEKYQELVLPPEARADIMSRLGIESEPHEEFDALVREVQRLQRVEAELMEKLYKLDPESMPDSLLQRLAEAAEEQNIALSEADSAVTTDGSTDSILTAPAVPEVEPVRSAASASPASLNQQGPAESETRKVSLTDRIGLSDEEQRIIRQQVNSLLNLDEEELGPIVRELSNTELIRLYSVASNQQREKLLRSLPPTRAARIMKEAML